MSVVFPEPSSAVLFNDSMKPLIGAVVLYLQVYHCPYPFSFAEAGSFKHTLRERTP